MAGLLKPHVAWQYFMCKMQLGHCIYLSLYVKIIS